jgi:Ubiquitin carboxyl-terminal hydrolase, family 1
MRSLGKLKRRESKLKDKLFQIKVGLGVLECLKHMSRGIICFKHQPIHKLTPVFFFRQTIGNACGTIGLLHALANNTEHLQMGDGPLAKLLNECKDMTPLERANHLETSTIFASIHQTNSLDGQTEAPDAEEDVNLHFGITA